MLTLSARQAHAHILERVEDRLKKHCLEISTRKAQEHILEGVDNGQKQATFTKSDPQAHAHIRKGVLQMVGLALGIGVEHGRVRV